MAWHDMYRNILGHVRRFKLYWLRHLSVITCPMSPIEPKLNFAATRLLGFADKVSNF